MKLVAAMMIITSVLLTAVSSQAMVGMPIMPVPLYRCVDMTYPMGKTIYDISVINSYGTDERYLLTVRDTRPGNVNGDDIILKSRPVAYGNTKIFTSDNGRSGYVHIYISEALTLIDINLWGRDYLNTNGPLTNYHCETMYTAL